MFWIAAAATLSATPAQPSEWRPSASAQVVQATVSIRVISGVTLKLHASLNEGAPQAHDSQVTTEQGLVRPARLIEFQ